VTEPTGARVLVTGASGFIGWHCLMPLRERGFEVHAVARTLPADAQPDVTWHRADLLEAGVAADIVERVRPTHLLHLAWFVTPGKVIASPLNYGWVAVSVDLLEAFVAAGGARAVMSGSAYEYDWAEGTCVEGTTPLVPDTVYGSCKAALYLLATSIARESDLSLAWVRPFFLYGPREHPDRLVASVARALLDGEPASTSHGRQRRDYLHVQDVADATVAVLDSTLVGPVNIGSGRAVELREIVTRIGALVGRPDLLRVGAIPARPNDVPLVVADTRRLSTELGWRPRFDLAAGLEATVAWWQARHATEAAAP
jgi:nucleoside-diphosphate-sugar epimerase